MSLVLGVKSLLEEIQWDDERTDEAEAAWARLGQETPTNAGCWADRSTFAFEDARDAAAMFAGPHSPGGKLALVPGA
jgi:hypothetical protein